MKDYKLKGVYSSKRDRIDIDIMVKTRSKAKSGDYIQFVYNLHCNDVRLFRTNKDILRVYYCDDMGYVKRNIDIYKVISIKIVRVNGMAYHGSQPDINEFEVVCDE